ncbi:MAG: anhydro-N-acetylmuramic acid kinase [Flavobacteriaceae bacterium]|nr:anhydro-N-acetylmuramic acid kinase [Flavobacteriaceae bacterium]
MLKNEYKIIGVMSGTSLDGVDMVYVSFKPENWEYDTIVSETVPYKKVWQERLSDAVLVSKEQLEELDKDYTSLLGDFILDFIAKNDIQQVDAVCSHGHTVLHQPDKGITLQIGNRPELAQTLGRTVVCDFRVQDVTLGGQGAPLVPIGDRLLFQDYDHCINLGGFANISYEKENQRIAFDICPVNIVMNHYCKSLGLDYDHGGKIASEGILNSGLLQELNSLEFYSNSPPKSLGLEWVNAKIIPLIDSYELKVKDVLRTFVEHIAIQISAVLMKNGTTLITGGGAYNDFLISILQHYTNGKLVIPSKDIIEYKEALIFGLLGVLRMRNEINCLKSVTGASKDHSSGMIFHPENHSN